MVRRAAPSLWAQAGRVLWLVRALRHPHRRRIALRPISVHVGSSVPVRWASVSFTPVATLDPETEAFLWHLVEAARAVPRSERGNFTAHCFAEPGNELLHAGLPAGMIKNFDEGDLRDLIEADLLRVTATAHNKQMFELRRGAFEAYDRAHRDAAAPVAAQERMVTEHISSHAFAARYRDASDRWRGAEALLWDDDSVKNLTDIGHRCREALQLFATRLIELHGVTGVESDPAKTVNRLRACIAARKPNLSTTVVGLLDALVGYWGSVSDLVQRQEHGAGKEGEELSWEDGRRVVLYTALVMHECDRALS
jgi:hypothetical protein